MSSKKWIPAFAGMTERRKSEHKSEFYFYNPGKAAKS
jgi:hypothetical protein